MTHPIVEAGSRAAYRLSTERMPWDAAASPLKQAYSRKAKATILAALRAMREPSPPVATALLKDMHPFSAWAGGIDALIKEIEE